MSEYAIVRINEKLIPEFQINYNAVTNTVIKNSVSSWQDINVQKSQELLLILSANLVINTQINIPSKNEEIIRQSIPFALEEQIASDVEDNHFANTQLGEQLFLVSIVDKNIMLTIKQALNSHNLTCEKLYSEIFSVPRHKDSISICEVGDYHLLNEDYAGTKLSSTMLKSYLRLKKSKNKIIYTIKQTIFEKNSQINVKQLDTVLLQAQTLNTGLTINLFQGEFAQNSDKKDSINPWKKLFGLVTVLVVSWLLINVYQLWSLSNTVDDLKQKQKTLLVKLIPDAGSSEQNNPYAAIQSRLKLANNSQNSATGSGFILSLTYLGKTLQQHKSIQVLSLRQRETKLEVKLQAPNVSSLNDFQQNLEKDVLNIRIKTGTRDTNKEGISSIITMEQL